MIRQGEIYLVDFGKKYNSEFGKLRPAVVIQNNLLNRALEISTFKSVLLAPLTTQICGGDYRLFVKKRDKLASDSEIVANWVCSLDVDMFDFEPGVLSSLAQDEFSELVKKISLVIG